MVLQAEKAYKDTEQVVMLDSLEVKVESHFLAEDGIKEKEEKVEQVNLAKLVELL
jgi:hypothetical protein